MRLHIMSRFTSSRIVRNYFTDAAFRMTTYKIHPEIVSVRVKYRGAFESIHISEEISDLAVFDRISMAKHVNEYFPNNRVIRNKDDVDRLVSDVTHGRYMLCLDIDDDGIFVYYIPDSLLDEYSTLVDKQRVVIVSKKIHNSERMPECPEIKSRDELKEVLKKYE